MALNEFVSGTLAVGAQNTIWYQRNNYQDAGIQIAMANPKNPGARLLIVDQGKEMRTGGLIVYWVTFKNIGGYATNYTVSAGGVV